MARQKREWYPGATYHVMSRGNRSLVLYKDEDDRYFLEVSSYIHLNPVRGSLRIRGNA